MSAPPVRLYIVDAEPALRAAFARLARSAKLEPVAFASAREFLTAELSDENACIICDVTLGTDGLDLPSCLARAGRHLPVIFLSVHDSDHERAIALNAGAAAYFRMPIDDQALLDAIAWALVCNREATPTR